MKWLKAILVGVIASFVMMFVLAGMIATGAAPINTTPAEALLVSFGVEPQPGGTVLHFAYGTFWSVVFVALVRSAMNIWTGLGLAMVLWLIMMLVHAPLIGWGVFGFGGAGQHLDSPDPLWIGGTGAFIVGTLALHLMCGLVLGWLNPMWIYGSARQRAEARTQSYTAPLADETA